MSLPVPGSKCGEETVIGGWSRARVAPGSDPASSGAPRAAVTLGPLRRPWCRLCQAPTAEVVCGAGGRPRTKPSVQVPSAPALLGLTVPSPIPRIPGGTRGGGQGGGQREPPFQSPCHGKALGPLCTPAGSGRSASGPHSWPTEGRLGRPPSACSGPQTD